MSARPPARARRVAWACVGLASLTAGAEPPERVPLLPNLVTLAEGSFVRFGVARAHHTDAETGAGRTTSEHSIEGVGELKRWLHVGIVVPVGTSALYRGHDRTVFGNVALDALLLQGGDLRDGSWRVGGSVRSWLPTASEPSGATFDVMQQLNVGHHLYDPGRFSPRAATLRPTAAAAVRRGPFVTQFEIGPDFMLGTDGAASETGLHAGVAPGMTGGPVRAYLEVARFSCISCNDGKTPGVPDRLTTSTMISGGVGVSVGPLGVDFVLVNSTQDLSHYVDGTVYRVDVHFVF